MVQEFAGEWVDPVAENMDEYLKECGINFILRKLAKTIKDKCIFVIERDKVTCTSESFFKTYTLSWVLNEKTLITSLDGRKYYSTFTYEDGKMIERQSHYKEGDKLSTIIRYVKEGKFFVESECNGVKATICYRKA
uniref:FABP domain-containing protein n=1 Tax=Strongyloides venezuelensis TaxID=75913 RepID=A0A0K0FV59_STRVS